MKAVTAAEIKEIDKRAEEEYKIPGALLMGFAGRAASDIILKTFPNADDIAVCAGTGNNGGDGFAAAYFLQMAGRAVKIFLCGEAEKITASASVYYNICRAAGIEIIAESAAPGLSGFNLIVDAVFGSGFKGPLREGAESIIHSINASGVPAAALDMPSGLPSDGEAAHWPVVKASLTIAMGLPKISLVTWPGRGFCGALEIADIGFPQALTSSDKIKTELIDEEFMRSAALSLKMPGGADTNKSERGHLLLIGGFDGMEGAIMMSAAAALESGTGLLTLISTAGARRAIAGIIPELITISAETGKIHETIHARRYDALLIGPGMGRSEYAAGIFKEAMDAFDTGTVLIDGDGLFHLPVYLENAVLKSGVKYVLTPHFMEASRIMKKSVDEIKENRLAAAKECALKTGCIVLLKGPASIVTDGERAYINTSGNNLLAAAGSGDVLSGILGALLLRKAAPAQAACAACYFHGKAADALAQAGKRHLRATDIISALKEIIP